MDLKTLQYYIQNDISRKEAILEAKRYYKVENDILSRGVVPKSENKDPLRSADNRINHNFHQLLVDEKASYLFTYPPLINLEDKTLQENINAVLEDEFEIVLKKLCINASNSGVAWLHYWICNEDNTNKFYYAPVNTEEIIPLYDNSLVKNLDGII